MSPAYATAPFELNKSLTSRVTSVTFSIVTFKNSLFMKLNDRKSNPGNPTLGSLVARSNRPFLAITLRDSREAS